MIYFIGNGRGQVKIGFSLRPFERLKMLQTASPDTLEILAMAPGREDKEKFYHEKYREYHINGEWFEQGDKLKIEIEVLQQCFKITPEFTDNNVIYQDRFRAWIEETDEVERKYDPQIAALEKEIEKLERQRDKEIEEIDKKYHQNGDKD